MSYSTKAYSNIHTANILPEHHKPLNLSNGRTYCCQVNMSEWERLRKMGTVAGTVAEKSF